MTKLQNPGLLWFPRGAGASLRAGHALRGGVRFIMPEDEYVFNKNLTLADRGAGCDSAVAPLVDRG